MKTQFWRKQLLLGLTENLPACDGFYQITFLGTVLWNIGKLDIEWEKKLL